MYQKEEVESCCVTRQGTPPLCPVSSPRMRGIMSTSLLSASHGNGEIMGMKVPTFRGTRSFCTKRWRCSCGPVWRLSRKRPSCRKMGDRKGSHLPCSLLWGGWLANVITNLYPNQRLYQPGIICQGLTHECVLGDDGRPCEPGESKLTHLFNNME